MPCPLRPQVAGGIYHLVSRGVRKLPVFTDDESRKRFLGLLDETLERYHWELHSWCLMTNHFHLLVTTVEPTVSDGMQYLNGCYGQWYDWRHGYEGHVFERRFWSQLIESDGTSTKPRATSSSTPFTPECARPRPTGSGPATERRWA
ncbi:MAG: transposase [Gaiellaceae bacterium]